MLTIFWYCEQVEANNILMVGTKKLQFERIKHDSTIKVWEY